MNIQPSDRVVVRTPDRREYRGQLLEIQDRDGKKIAIVKLDTGWQVSYPLGMVHREV